MPVNELEELIHTRIDPAIMQRATTVLAEAGLTVSDAVRILLTRTADEGTLPFTSAPHDPQYDAWFANAVQEAIDDPSPTISNEEMKAEFATRRAEALARAEALGL